MRRVVRFTECLEPARSWGFWSCRATLGDSSRDSARYALPQSERELSGPDEIDGIAIQCFAIECFAIERFANFL